MGHNTSNSVAFIEQEIYSDFILRALPDGLLPDTMSRDVGDFGSGTTLNIPVVGTATLQDVSEEQPMTYNAIDTGRVNLTITEYVGDAWSISDILRQDGTNIEALHQARAMESTRALQEYFETQFLAACNSAQTAGAANNINGFAHRIGSAETDDVISLNHFNAMKLSFDKGNAPQGGRIAIVDPVCEATINENFTASAAIQYNPAFEGIINEGFAREHRFVKNIFGWDIYTSNRLAKASSMGDGTETITNAVGNVFMTVANDQVKPMMRAWRQPVQVETGRDKKLKRDEFDTTARFGIGAQRVDTLGILVTSDRNY